MNITIHSTAPYKAFNLSQSIEFNGFLCVITGKNGSGKTRLLESLINNHSIITIDEKVVPQDQISLIDMSSAAPTILSPFYQLESGRRLVDGVFQLISIFDDIDSVPESHPIYVHSDRRMEGNEEFKVKDIISNAELLFNKPMKELEHIELEFSIYLHKDMINSRLSHYPASLSELTVNYHQTIDKKSYIEFLNSRGDDINNPNADIANRHLGEESPHVPFNRIIKKLFRGKFIISDPDIKRAKIGYLPKLILTSSKEEIDPKDLSSGEKTIFWLAEKTFHTTYAKSNAIFNNKTIILIDEPDSHLHPQMVIDFYDCLKNLHEALGVIFIFNTHSPTTIALCPNDNIFNMNFNLDENNFSLTRSDKDGAISQLLEGVSQIAINPENSRQVYVENSNDSYVYEKLYISIKNRSKVIDPKINLSFISAGPKIADSELSKHIHCVFGESEKSKTLIDKINGDANCQQVIGMVEHLVSRGNRTVRGLIDWDNQTRIHRDEVVVFAKDYAYSIENIVYDPISIYAYLTANDYKKPSYFFKVEEDYFWRDCLSENKKLQLVVDLITSEVLGRPNANNHTINYMSGLTLSGDKEYFIPANGENGHDFEQRILDKYPDINKLKVKGSSRPLIYYFTVKATLGQLGWEFVNNIVENAIVNLQK